MRTLPLKSFEHADRQLIPELTHVMLWICYNCSVYIYICLLSFLMPKKKINTRSSGSCKKCIAQEDVEWHVASSEMLSIKSRNMHDSMLKVSENTLIQKPLIASTKKPQFWFFNGNRNSSKLNRKQLKTAICDEIPTILVMAGDQAQMRTSLDCGGNWPMYPSRIVPSSCAKHLKT